ncbi:MAG: OFA family MFS transporter [Pirellulales bacterium]|nr:OFA family MFS transporter [Pirellulales bacterium]
METKVMNRWLVVVGAILIQLCLGAIYAWSVFTPSLLATSPGDIAGIYRAKQLGMADRDFEQMNAALKAPRDALKEIAAKLKGATGKTALEKKEMGLLQDQKGALTKQIDEIVSSHVAKERIDRLSYAFSNAKTQAIFAAGLAAFAVIMVLAGRQMPTLGPQKLAIAGGVVLGLGYILAGLLGGKSFLAMLVCIGLIGGAGIGLAYVVPIAVGMKWFPDKKGTITGLAVAGFGFGALLWVQLAGEWGHLIATFGLNTTFIIYGIIFLVTCLIGAVWMKNPPEGWKPAGWEPPQANASGKAVAGTVDIPSSAMLKTPQFFMIFICFAFGAGAGLMSIGLMKAFPMKAMMSANMDWAAASAAAGLAMAVFFSLANGIGRIAWGMLSDKIGRKASVFIMLATQGIVVIAFQKMAGTPSLLYLGAALIGFNFGGNFALFPTITADTFGTKYLAQNYGWVFLSYGAGGIIFPLLGGMLGDMGNFPLAFTICGLLCLVAAAITLMVRPPKHA